MKELLLGANNITNIITIEENIINITYFFKVNFDEIALPVFNSVTGY